MTDFERSQVLKWLGYGRRPAPKIIVARLDELEQGIDRWYEPVYKSKKVALADLPFQSTYIDRHTGGNLRGALLVYSIGPKVEGIMEEMSQANDMAGAYVLDKISVVMLDRLGADIEAELLKDEAGLKVYRSFSPGDADFEVGAQAYFYEALHLEEIGISISEHHQFAPMKTVSKLLVFGQERSGEGGCAACSAVECPMREESP